MLIEHIYINCHGKAAHVSTCQGDCHSHTISCLMSYPFLLISLFLTFLHVWAFLSYFWPKLSQIWVWVMYFCHHVFSRFNTFLLLSYMGCFKNKDWSRPNKSVVLDDLGGLLVMNGELIMAPSGSTAVMFFVEELSCSFQNQTHTHIYIYMYTYKYHPMITSNQAGCDIDLNSENPLKSKAACQPLVLLKGKSEWSLIYIDCRLLMMRSISKPYRDQHVKNQIGKSCSQLPIVALPRQFLWACQWSPTSAGVHPRTSRNQQALVTSNAKISQAKINVAVGK